MGVRGKSPFRDYILILIGASIMGFAIKNIYDPIGLVTGGASGVAIILKKQFGVPLWLTNTAINIPLFAAAAKLKGWSFIKRTLLATVTLSVSLYVIPEMPFLMDDLFLTALFGGLITGAGAGIGAGIFGVTYALYALIAIYAVSKVSDGIIEGMKYSKVAYIISDKSEEIAAAILKELERGVTALDARGMYSGNRKDVLFCVVSRKEIAQLKELVVGHDAQAFVIVSDAREVLGEGFIEYRQ